MEHWSCARCGWANLGESAFCRTCSAPKPAELVAQALPPLPSRWLGDPPQPRVMEWPSALGDSHAARQEPVWQPPTAASHSTAHTHQVMAVAAVVHYQTPRHSVLAVVALVASLVAIVAYPLTFGVGGFLLSVASVVMGHLARSEIRRGQGTVTGDSVALAALIIGYLSISVVAPIACVMTSKL